MVVAPAAEVRDAGTRGAAGLLVPGAGPTVTREGARASLVRGRVRNAVLGGTVGGKPLITLARKPGAITIYVALPPEGESHNVRRYPVAIVGPGYRGVLKSSATRLPGLVGIADLAPTAVALARGREPIVTAEAADDPASDLRSLDRRLSAAHDARTAANVVLVAFIVLAAAVGLARRSAFAARAAVLAGPAAVTAALLLSALGPTRSGLLAAGFAVAMPALALVGAAARLVPVVVGFLVLYALVLALWPETASLGVVGPHPDGGVRFYGVTNQVETLLLAPVILAIDRSRVWVAVAIGLLALFTVGSSWTGADGGGVVVLTAAFAALAVLRSDLELSWRRAGVALAGAAALALLVVGVDAAAGGTSHVTRAVGGGPGTLLDDLLDRLHLSAASVSVSWASALAVVAAVAGLIALARLRRRPRTLDAMLVALVVSLLVNDSPVDVALYGALGALSIVAYERARD
ncbi:MAG TPA: hypothetical protein VFP31_06630 [Gaiellaceae bacterium]|nr:hypothetical protein [Gaiellaceae bacterium]